MQESKTTNVLSIDASLRGESETQLKLKTSLVCPTWGVLNSMGSGELMFAESCTNPGRRKSRATMLNKNSFRRRSKAENENSFGTGGRMCFDTRVGELRNARLLPMEWSSSSQRVHKDCWSSLVVQESLRVLPTKLFKSYQHLKVFWARRWHLLFQIWKYLGRYWWYSSF